MYTLVYQENGYKLLYKGKVPKKSSKKSGFLSTPHPTPPLIWQKTIFFTGFFWHPSLRFSKNHWQDTFEIGKPINVGPLPKGHYALEAYSNNTWEMVIILFRFLTPDSSIDDPVHLFLSIRF